MIVPAIRNVGVLMLAAIGILNAVTRWTPSMNEPECINYITRVTGENSKALHAAIEMLKAANALIGDA